MTAPALPLDDLRPDHLALVRSGTGLDPEASGQLSARRRLAELVGAVERSRAPLPAALAAPGGLAVLHQADLRAALRTGELGRAEDAALALWRRQGLTRVHAVVESLLAVVAKERAAGLTGLVDERLALATAERLVARLHARTPLPAREGLVVVVADGWGAATVVARARAHQVEEAGWPSIVVGRSDAALLAATEGVLHVVEADDDLGAVLAGLARGPLTQREAQVLQCVADGLTNAEAGATLGIGPATVRSHLDRVFAKTGTTHRAAAVAVALRSGWVS